MRIIAGKFKGRIIRFPNSKLVRPTTDKVKESLFNYLVHAIDFDGIKVCDLYAGSGSLGLEALSRGASEIHFVEKDFRVSTMLRENISSLFAESNCKVFRMEAVRFSKMTGHEKYNLIFADPPFFKNDIHKVVVNVLTNNFLTDGGLLIVERSIQTQKEDEAAFRKTARKKIGDSLIYLFHTSGKVISGENL